MNQQTITRDLGWHFLTLQQRTCQDDFPPRNSPLISSLLPQTGTDFTQISRTAFLTYW